MMAGTIFFCMELHFVKSDAKLLLRNFLKYNVKRQFWVKYTKLSFFSAPAAYVDNDANP